MLLHTGLKVALCDRSPRVLTRKVKIRDCTEHPASKDDAQPYREMQDSLKPMKIIMSRLIEASGCEGADGDGDQRSRGWCRMHVRI